MGNSVLKFKEEVRMLLLAHTDANIAYSIYVSQETLSLLVFNTIVIYWYFLRTVV
jgi:hypothetical protein